MGHDAVRIADERHNRNRCDVALGTSSSLVETPTTMRTGDRGELFPHGPGRIRMQVERQVHRNIVEAGGLRIAEDQDGVIMRPVALRPTLTLRGSRKRLRGWSGKPVHSKLTAFPIAAYLLAVGLDAVSIIGGDDRTWSRELWHVGTYLFVAGAVVSVLAALMSMWDAWKSSESGTQARRSTNTDATIMIGVTVLALVAVVWRLYGYHTEPATPVEIMLLSVVIAWLVSLGGTFGGTPLYDYKGRT
jgi:uncharacterized membrane protein